MTRRNCILVFLTLLVVADFSTLNSHSFLPAALAAEGVPSLRAKAEQGNAEAQARLADMYERGLGVPRDYTQALLWFHKAADQGNAVAFYGLGYMYSRGEGVPVDKAQAISWFRKSSATLGKECQQGKTLSCPTKIAIDKTIAQYADQRDVENAQSQENGLYIPVLSVASITRREDGINTTAILPRVWVICGDDGYLCKKGYRFSLASPTTVSIIASPVEMNGDRYCSLEIAQDQNKGQKVFVKEAELGGCPWNELADQQRRDEQEQHKRQEAKKLALEQQKQDAAEKLRLTKEEKVLNGPHPAGVRPDHDDALAQIEVFINRHLANAELSNLEYANGYNSAGEYIVIANWMETATQSTAQAAQDAMNDAERIKHDRNASEADRERGMAEGIAAILGSGFANQFGTSVEKGQKTEKSDSFRFVNTEKGWTLAGLAR